MEQKIHTEKLSFECFGLAKKRFSWRLPEYAKFPDKELVRFALKDATGQQLIQGRAGAEASGKDLDGWMFTPIGAKWILENVNRIEKELKVTGAGTRRPDAVRIKRRYYQDPAFKKFLAGGNLNNVSQYEFTDMLNCTPDANRATIRKKFDRLKTQSIIVDDIQIQEFIAACEVRFKGLIVDETVGGQNESR